jgi:hypothetical protein
LQDGQSLLFLVIGAAGGRRDLEPFNARFHIRFKPTANGVFMTATGDRNGRNTVASVREQNREAAFGQAGGYVLGLTFRMRRALSRASRCSWGRYIWIISQLSFQVMRSVLVLMGLNILSLPTPVLSYKSFRTGA